MTLEGEGLLLFPVRSVAAGQVLRTILQVWCCPRLTARYSSRCALFALDVQACPRGAAAALVAAFVALASGYAFLEAAPAQR